MRKKVSKMRIKSSMQQKMTLRRVILLSSSFVILLTVGIILFINLTDSRTAYGAAANGDYQSKSSGNWNSTTTWQRFNGTSWVNAAAAPTSGNGVITILSGHSVTVTANVTADQIVVSSGGFLIINNAITLTLNAGTGNDLDVLGTVKNAGTITRSGAATIVVQNGGKYQHNYTTTAGTIPTATWSAGSTCEIIGYTNNNTAPSGLQTFSNFTWNCPSQTQDISLGGGLTTVNGNLTIANTGASNYLRLSTAGATTISVGGDFIQTGGNFTIIKGNAVTTMNITGNYNQSGGVFTVVDGNNNCTINLSGNMSHTGGSLTQLGSSVVSFEFRKAGTQTYTSSGNSVSGSIDYTVNSGSILDVGTSIVSGRNFTLSSGAGLAIGSVQGISANDVLGNIQVSGTRSFNSGADYIYDGTTTQETGLGLPATVRNLTVNNSNNVRLTSTVAVSGTLTFLSGKIGSGSNEIHITNTSTSSIVGYSTSNYVIGGLRRSVSGTGSYDFPIGTAANYEVITVNLASVTGTTNILASFTNSTPLIPALPLVGVLVNNLTIDKMMTYGYWTLTPNFPILTGTYTLSATELVASLVVNSGCSYSLLNRLTSLLPWASVGTHSASTQAVVGSAVTAVRSALNVFGDFSIGYGELLSFSSPTVISGSNGAVNAIYLFPDACSNVDAWVQIIALDNGITLNSIDNFSGGNGYQEGWQPFLNVPANKTSSILWKIMFKVAGTSTDTILPWLAISGIDIDAGSGIQEFVEATYPYSYGLSGSTSLAISNNSGTYRATASNAMGSIANIDTGVTQAMFQINYKDVSSFYYRTGVISTSNSPQTRQTSLYFKSFFSNNLALPIKLLYFESKLKNKKVDLTWSTGSEVNNSYFTLERSSDGENFESIGTERGAGNSNITLYYKTTDESPLSGVSFYRLKQTDFDGHFTYSEVRMIKYAGEVSENSLEINSIGPNPFSENCTVNFKLNSDEVVNMVMFNSVGQEISRDVVNANAGYNNYSFQNLENLIQGVYFISLSYGDQKITRKVLKK